MSLPVEDRVEAVMRLLADGASSEYFGEPVTQLEHALQAAQLAKSEGAREETIIAALLHDVGHLLPGDSAEHSELGAADHDELGAQYLSSLGFSSAVARLVGGHVTAKRYLTATQPSYYEKLSDASRQTLKLQGGPMNPAEVAGFEADPLAREILQLRLWDEQAKIPGAQTPELEHYRGMLRAHLAQDGRGA